MNFGICYPPDRTPAVVEAGFDFVEWPMSRTVGEMDDEEYQSLRGLARTLPIVPEAWNVMLPRTIMVVGPDADLPAMKDYVEQAFARAGELGGKVVVFGSGGSRNVPEGWSRDDGIRQFDEACAVAGEVAARHDITVAIEPLNRGETNLVNSVSEAFEVVERVGHQSVKLLSDLYHVEKERESLDDTGAAASVLAHVHVAEPESRGMPRAGTLDSVYREYFSVLHQAGYDGRISVEARSPEINVAAEGLVFLRQVWSDVASGSTV